jgi:hypothetical protein
LIAKRISKVEPRNKLSSDALAAQESIRSFCKRVAGAWWERITIEDPNAISFFRIAHEVSFNSVSLRRSSYNQDGSLVAHWNSVMARVAPAENQILYHWKGRHTRADVAHVSFHGLCEMEFEEKADTDKLITRGRGRFWDVNEAYLDKTIIKPIQLRRVTERQVISTMTTGKANDIRTLVVQTLAEW